MLLLNASSSVNVADKSTELGDAMHAIYHRMELMLLMYTFSLAGFVEFSDDI